MANTTPIPEVLIQPPRSSGNIEQDLPALIDWIWVAYQIIGQATEFINGQVTEVPDFEVTDLPDPASTNLYQAQETANAAYGLAKQADDKADENSEDIDTILALYANMPKGTVELNDPETGFELTFAKPQPDLNYSVFVQPLSASGTPAPGAFTVTSKTYTLPSFTVTILETPGVGSSVTYEYRVIRTT